MAGVYNFRNLKDQYFIILYSLISYSSFLTVWGLDYVYILLYV